MSGKRDISKLPKADPRPKWRKPSTIKRPDSPFTATFTEGTSTLDPPLPDPGMEESKKTKAHADEIVERVFSDGGTGELTKADEKFVQLNRMYIVLAAKSRNIDLVGRYIECIEKSYERGMDKDFNKTEPNAALGNRKHVTSEVGKLAKLDRKEDEGGGKEIKLVFHSSFNPNGNSECTIGVSVCPASGTTEGD